MKTSAACCSSPVWALTLSRLTAVRSRSRRENAERGKNRAGPGAPDPPQGVFEERLSPRGSSHWGWREPLKRRAFETPPNSVILYCDLAHPDVQHQASQRSSSGVKGLWGRSFARIQFGSLQLNCIGTYSLFTFNHHFTMNNAASLCFSHVRTPEA